MHRRRASPIYRKGASRQTGGIYVPFYRPSGQKHGRSWRRERQTWMVEVGSKETEMTGNDVPRYELRRAHAVSQVAVISHAEQGMISFAFRVRIQATRKPRQRKPCRDEDTRGHGRVAGSTHTGVILVRPAKGVSRSSALIETKRHTLGMSWCSLNDSSFALNSATRSLWVLDASFPTLAAIYICKNHAVNAYSPSEDETRTRSL
jgi:hypothetical protein